MHAPRLSSILWMFIVIAAATGPAYGASGVASVVDGDTIEIRGERIRLHGIDAPESGQHCRYAGTLQRCGQQAATFLEQLIASRPVQCERKDRDRYGRLIGVCKVSGTNLNAAMVRNGWALAYVQYSRDYVLDEQAAAEELLGIWRYEFEAPWDYRKGTRNSSAAPSTKPAAIGTAATSGRDRDCKDFGNQAEAQAFFEAAGPGDPHRLDRDRDGRVCERLP